MVFGSLSLGIAKRNLDFFSANTESMTMDNVGFASSKQPKLDI